VIRGARRPQVHREGWAEADEKIEELAAAVERFLKV
jgi:hypothetical protein